MFFLKYKLLKIIKVQVIVNNMQMVQLFLDEEVNEMLVFRLFKNRGRIFFCHTVNQVVFNLGFIIVYYCRQMFVMN